MAIKPGCGRFDAARRDVVLARNSGRREDQVGNAILGAVMARVGRNPQGPGQRNGSLANSSSRTYIGKDSVRGAAIGSVHNYGEIAKADIEPFGKIRRQSDIRDLSGVDVLFGIAQIAYVCLLERRSRDVVATIRPALLKQRMTFFIGDQRDPSVRASGIGGVVETTVVWTVSVGRAISIDGHASGEKNSTIGIDNREVLLP